LNLPATPEETSLELESEAAKVHKVKLEGKTFAPTETLQFVEACSSAIHAHGLETLGLMRPNWHAASPTTQAKLLTGFVSENENWKVDINHASPHDVASVLRWSLRHLQLPPQGFGNSEAWYSDFFTAEKKSGYQPKAYSEALVPLLPETNAKLLAVILDLASSLAAHSEANGISGSKFSRLVGFWLLASNRVGKNETWATFYQRWDETGRMLEHLFLARIRYASFFSSSL
jgi:hypothetical protein